MPQEGDTPKRDLDYYLAVIDEFALETNAVTTRDGPEFMALVEARDNQGEQHTVKVELRRNFYNHQSYGRIYAWTALGWKLVYSIPYPLLAIVSQPTHSTNGVTFTREMLDAMHQDAAKLLRAAEIATGWKYSDDSFDFD